MAIMAMAPSRFSDSGLQSQGFCHACDMSHIVYINEDLCRLAATVLLCSEPVDRLVMRIQHETEAGSLLLHLLHEGTNPFIECQKVMTINMMIMMHMMATNCSAHDHHGGGDALDGE
eukprot:8435087-Karenia_brevis.AAC.1